MEIQPPCNESQLRIDSILCINGLILNGNDGWTVGVKTHHLSFHQPKHSVSKLTDANSPRRSFAQARLAIPRGR